MGDVARSSAACFARVQKLSPGIMLTEQTLRSNSGTSSTDASPGWMTCNRMSAASRSNFHRSKAARARNLRRAFLGLYRMNTSVMRREGSEISDFKFEMPLSFLHSQAAHQFFKLLRGHLLGLLDNGRL